MNPEHAQIIGNKLRAIRKDREMSLRELADKAEMSASMLSQIETGKAFPSVRSIYGIAAALGVSVDYFFPDQSNGHAALEEPIGNTSGELTASEMREAQVNRAPGVNQGESAAAAVLSPVIHRNARPMIELKGGVSWSRLTALAESGAEFLEITYSPGASSGANMSHHEGREFGLVLEGELVIELGFESHTLCVGDSIIFESTTPHRLANRGNGLMRAIWVVLSKN